MGAETAQTERHLAPDETASDFDMIALFGPTSVGKTGIALEMARLLRQQGQDPVVVNCDSIQIYRGLAVLSGAATAAERAELEHRLVAFVDASEEMSAGVFAALAHAEIDELIRQGRLPMVVGGTGLWLRAALCELDLRPQVDIRTRDDVDREIASRGAPALHRELPEHLAEKVHPNDRNRISRWTALVRSGVEPETDSNGMWAAPMRHPTRLVGLIDDREALARRIDRRVDAMAQEAKAEAEALLATDASRTARAAIGVEEFITGDLDEIKAQHRAYAKRQVTWMRRMPGVDLIERRGETDARLARRILGSA